MRLVTAADIGRSHDNHHDVRQANARLYGEIERFLDAACYGVSGGAVNV